MKIGQCEVVHERVGILRAIAEQHLQVLLDHAWQTRGRRFVLKVDRHDTQHESVAIKQLARIGGVEAAEMLRVFNCGVGMAVVVSDPDAARAVLTEAGESVSVIGRIAAGSGPASIRIDLPTGWPSAA